MKGTYKIANILYSEFIDDTPQLEHKIRTWEQRLGVPTLSIEDFCKNFTYVPQVTISMKLRDFQYRLLHNAIITNTRLCKWGILVHDLCTFCKTTAETILHLFCECDVVKSLLQGLRNYVQQNVFQNCNWSNQNFLFNTVHENPSHVINLLVIITKQYIYRQRCLHKCLFLPALTQEIELVYMLEYRIAKSTARLKKHIIKWMVLKPELEQQLQDLQNQNFIQNYLDNV